MTNTAPEFIVKSRRPLAAEVRAWGRDNDFKGKTEKMVSASTRGKLSPVLIAAFNAKHKGANAYSEKDRAPKSVTLTVKPEKGRAKTVRVNVAEARKAAEAKGLTVGKRGNLSEATVKALVFGQ